MTVDEFDGLGKVIQKEIEMTDIEHVHVGLFQIGNISVPFVISQDSKNTIGIEIGNYDDAHKCFSVIQISVEIDGTIRFEGSAGNNSPQVVTLGNILTGHTGAMRISD